MKLFSLVFLSLLVSMITFGQGQPISIIPEPVNLLRKSGAFQLKDKLVVSASSDPEMKHVLDALKKITVATGIPVSTSTSDGSASVNLVLNKTADNRIGKEGYQL